MCVRLRRVPVMRIICPSYLLSETPRTLGTLTHDPLCQPPAFVA